MGNMISRTPPPVYGLDTANASREALLNAGQPNDLEAAEDENDALQEVFVLAPLGEAGLPPQTGAELPNPLEASQRVATVEAANASGEAWLNAGQPTHLEAGDTFEEVLDAMLARTPSGAGVTPRQSRARLRDELRAVHTSHAQALSEKKCQCIINGCCAALGAILLGTIGLLEGLRNADGRDDFDMNQAWPYFASAGGGGDFSERPIVRMG
jgi:hypothetical protein